MSEGQHIGRLREKSLHAALKAYYANPGDRLEVPIAGMLSIWCRQGRRRC